MKIICVEDRHDGLTTYLFELQSAVQDLLDRSDISASHKIVMNRRIEKARNRYLHDRHLQDLGVGGTRVNR